MKRGLKTKRLAQDFERNFLEKSQADCTMLFVNLYDLYMEDCLTRLKPTTYENKKVLIELKILPYFKDKELNKIEPSMVRQWQNQLMQQNYSLHT